MARCPLCVSSGAEIIEYAIWLGMDPVKEKELLWIAAEGIKVTSIAHTLSGAKSSGSRRPLISSLVDHRGC
jgi:hypothetical protein